MSNVMYTPHIHTMNYNVTMLLSSHHALVPLNTICSAGTPVAVISALHSGPGAQKQDVRDAGNLQSKLAIAVGTRVMYVQNKWHAGKLINGSQEEVVDILYGEDSGPPDRSTARSNYQI